MAVSILRVKNSEAELPYNLKQVLSVQSLCGFGLNATIPNKVFEYNPMYQDTALFIIKPIENRICFSYNLAKLMYQNEKWFIRLLIKWLPVWVVVEYEPFTEKDIRVMMKEPDNLYIEQGI